MRSPWMFANKKSCLPPARAGPAAGCVQASAERQQLTSPSARLRGAPSASVREGHEGKEMEEGRELEPPSASSQRACSASSAQSPQPGEETSAEALQVEPPSVPSQRACSASSASPRSLGARRSALTHGAELECICRTLLGASALRISASFGVFWEWSLA
jgi:hypothetical protein